MEKKRLSQGVSSGTMHYVTKGIRYVCEHFKNRGSGTQVERDAQDYFAQELRQWADEVETEDFKLRPAGFMGWTVIIGIFMVVAVILPWIMPHLAILSMILTVLGVLMFLFEFILYRPFIDFLFPQKISRNLMAKRKPAGEVKRRIVFGGHADAPNEWTWSYHGQLKTLAIVILGGTLGLIYTLISDLVYLSFGMPDIAGAWIAVFVVQLLFIPTYIMAFLFTNWRVICDGANDNLSACYASIAVLKELAERNIRFENTEVCCLITGSEEAGLRGAKAYAKAHNQELRETETVLIPLETLREIDQMAIYTKDETGTVHNSEAIADLLVEAAENLDFSLPRADVYPGSTDAAAYTQAGLLSAGLGGVNHNPKTYYHTRLDSWDNISPACIELSIDIALEAAHLYDQKGGIAPYIKKYPREQAKLADIKTNA